jgi:F-type H+-transporting ATPase subunit delta
LTKGGVGAADRYAHAAFDVARAHHDVEAWQTYLNQLERILTDEDVRLALENPRLDTGRRIGLALSLLPADTDPRRQNFLKLLVMRQRTQLIAQVRKEFETLVDASEGRIELELTVAADLPEEAREQLTRVLREKAEGEVRVDFHVDPDILGGAIVRHGDHVTDGSVRRRLLEMRQELLAG